MFFFINNYDIVSLVELWNFLDTTFFSKLETDFSLTIRKLEISLKRYYLIYATNSGRLDKVREFFEMYASELAKVLKGQDEMRWKEGAEDAKREDKKRDMSWRRW